MWSSKDTAPKTGEWIVVRDGANHPVTVRWFNPFPANKDLADWRDERGKVRIFTEWILLQ